MEENKGDGRGNKFREKAAEMKTEGGKRDEMINISEKRPGSTSLIYKRLS